MKKDDRKAELIKRNEHARAWLKDRDINVAKLCRRINYDRGNFWGFELGNRDLSERALERLEKELIRYNFKLLK